MSASPDPTYRPSPEHEIVLAAAFLHGEAGRHALDKFRTRLDIDHLDVESYRLLPLVHRNMRRLGVDHPDQSRLKGIHRHTLVRNHILLHQVRGILEALHGAGIDTLVLKGAALALTHYKDLGLRPMDDLDLLVPIDRALAARRRQGRRRDLRQ